MAWWRQNPVDAISSDDLARFGRTKFIGPGPGEIDDVSTAFDAVQPLFGQLFGTDEPQPNQVLAELRRHAAQGPWEAVGAWQFVRDFLDDDQAPDLVDTGLAALVDMRVTNLDFHLNVADRTRFRGLFGQPPPHDGFHGPPVFDSAYGPSRQFYFDQAVAAAEARVVRRLPSRQGADPESLDGAVTDMWDFGQLVLRGPLVVQSDRRVEAEVVRNAVVAARNVDHARFLDALVDEIDRQSAELPRVWWCMGTARFVEDYLDRALSESPLHTRLVDLGLKLLRDADILGTSVCADVLSPFERRRLAFAAHDGP